MTYIHYRNLKLTRNVKLKRRTKKEVNYYNTRNLKLTRKTIKM